MQAEGVLRLGELMFEPIVLVLVSGLDLKVFGLGNSGLFELGLKVL